MSEFTASSRREEDEDNSEDNFVPFDKYSSFRNAYVEAEVEYIKNYVPENEEWIALEKVHGCNFSATTNDVETRWASRSGYLDPQSLLSFNNAPIVVEKYESVIKSLLFSKVQEVALETRKQNLSYIRVFGELFGGKYEGHETKYRAIQKEVSYCPGIDFAVFDIECILDVENSDDTVTDSQKANEDEGDDKDVTSKSFFLTHPEVVQLCQECQLPVLDILHSGSLADMLSLVPVFQSTLPTTMFNLPSLTKNNEAEGFVLKPKSQVFYKPDGSRIMLKHKNPAFTENCNTKTVKVPKTTQNPYELSTEESAMFEKFKEYINDNRINAVLSKLDESKKSKPKSVYYLIAQDAFDDILIEMSVELESFTKQQKNKLKTHLIKYSEQYCTFHQVDFLS